MGLPFRAECILNTKERKSATVLSRSLQKASETVQSGERSASVIMAQIIEEISTEPLVSLDYIEIVEGRSLKSINEIKEGSRILLAANVGEARLIDNVDPYVGIQ